MRAYSAVKNGTFWTVFQFGSQKVMQLGANLVLTRLLFPEAFGLMAIVSVVLIGLNMFSDLGLQAAIVQSKRGDEPNFLSTAWTVQIFRGFGLTASALALAWPISLMYAEPVLMQLISIVSLTALIKGFSSVGIPYTQRKLQLRNLAILELLAQFTIVCLSIILAAIYKSVWTLAVANVCGALVHMAMSFVLTPSKHNRFMLDKQSLQDILSFGKWIFGGTLLTYLGGRGIIIIQGRLVGMEALGLITIASTLAWALGEFVAQVLKKVVFPHLSTTFRENPELFQREFFKVNIIMCAAVLPGFLTLSLLSNYLIDLLYDDRYLLAGNYLAILSIGSSFACIAMIYQNALLSNGLSKAHFKIMGCNAVFKIIFVIVGFYTFGVYGMLMASGLAALATFFMSVYYSNKIGMSRFYIDVLFLIPLLLGGIITYFVHFYPN